MYTYTDALTIDNGKLVAVSSTAASIVIPPEVVEIADGVFADVAPKLVVEVHPENRNFKLVDGFLYSIDDKVIYHCPRNLNKHLSPPKTVERIAKGAFRNAQFTAFHIQDTLLSFDLDDYYSCKNLGSPKVEPNNPVYRKIDNLFYRVARDEEGQTDLELLAYYPTSPELALPNELTRIHPLVKIQKSAVAKLTLPQRLVEFSDKFIQELVMKSPELREIAVDGSNPRYLTSEGALYRREEDQTLTLLVCPPSYDGDLSLLPGTTTALPFAFQNCSKLRSVAFPPSFTPDVLSYLDDCVSLKHIRYPENANYKRDKDAIVSRDGKTLYGRVDKESDCFVAPPGVERVARLAFSADETLKNLYFTDNLKYIDSGAFSDCAALYDVELPDSLEVIGDKAFQNCSNLKEFNFPRSVVSIGFEAFAQCASLTSVSLPDSAQSLGEALFYQCGALTSVRCPSALKTIPKSFLRECVSLRKFDMPKTVKAVGECAFLGCSALNDITFSPQLHTIGMGAFGGCAFSALKLPQTVNFIEPAAFYNCAKLEQIELPVALNALADNTFQNCVALKRFEFPEGFECIGSSCFRGCDSLTAVTLPDSLKILCEAAFAQCANLVEVKFPNALTKLEPDMFLDCKALSVVKLPDSLTTIGENAFGNCEALHNIAFPEALTSIGARAFYRCKNLEAVAFPEQLETIHDYAFAGCSSLTNLTLPPNITLLRNGVFSSCTALESVAFNTSLTTILSEAFSHCASLRTVTLPPKLNTIYSRAFSGCFSLKKVILEGILNGLGEKAFDTCPNLTLFRYNDGTLEKIVAKIKNYCPEAISYKQWRKLRAQYDAAFPLATAAAQ